ncbi:GTP pyrophosphokinase family protein [Allomuricauda sp. CP2A]|jgi:ppGpp synthetase/RelA/SpoT-type nucleotidyltranferase|uniref:GTP pyrophosphokinase n=1 Tax=Allomuricauda sp. CP2A TaxID=1848189 RepID=UPI00082E9C9F|nr:hypothetical protein [Muricauda sp. CP2A]
MNLEQVERDFKDNITQYETLGKNLSESLKFLLKKKNIQILSLSYRIKNTESFLEKIERKSYSNPLLEIEDICGIRVICYYKRDIKRIKEILSKELVIHESTDKEEVLKYDQFGYRSHHLIASINKDWDSTPIFRGLSNLKCEIQIRTVLMHTWAEIEHSLSYKNEVQTPSQFRRKIHLISAMLEVADGQFEELKIESEKYQKALSKKIIEPDEKVELNLDTLQAFMDNNLPKRQKDIDATGQLLNQMIRYHVSLNDLRKAWQVVKDDFYSIEKDFWGNRNSSFTKWIQAGIARFVLDISHPEFIKRLPEGPQRLEREKYRKKYFE